MGSTTRARIALAALLGIFLIPLFTSSLNGLTHVLTCEAGTSSSFTIEASDNAPPVVSSSAVVVKGQDPTLCGGLTLDMGVGTSEQGKVAIIVPITNHSRYPWRGSVKLVFDDVSVPLDIGEVQPGDTQTGRVDVPLDAGDHQIDGTLLIGP